jgi:hypothetical protein
MKRTAILLALVCLGAAGGTNEIAFRPVAVLDPGVGASPESSADFDGDGLTDVVRANPGDMEVYLLLNRGDGTFARSDLPAPTWTPRDPVPADFNGDGRMDVAFRGSRTAGLTALGIYIADGAGGHTLAYYEGLVDSLATPVDVDGDGDLDIPVASYRVEEDPYDARDVPEITAGVTVFENDGAGQFTARETYRFTEHLPGEDFTPCFGDFDGDGKAEMVVRSDGAVRLHKGLGEGRFGEPTTLFDLDGDHILIADLDGDGHLDVLAKYCHSREYSVLPPPGLYLARGRGDGSFEETEYQEAANCHVGGDRWQLSASDLDGDGDLDLVTNQGSVGLSILPNPGDGRFSAATLLMLEEDGEEVFPAAFSVGEWDGEPGTDILTSSWEGHDQVLARGGGVQPLITDVTPSVVHEGGVRTFAILGSGFEPGVEVLTLRDDGTRRAETSVTRIDSGRLEITVTLVTTGIQHPWGYLHDIVVRNPSGAAARAVDAIHLLPEFDGVIGFVKGRIRSIPSEFFDRVESSLKVRGTLDDATADAIFAAAAAGFGFSVGTPEYTRASSREIDPNDPFLMYKLKISRNGRRLVWRSVDGRESLKIRRTAKGNRFKLRYRVHLPVSMAGHLFLAIEAGDTTAYGEDLWPEVKPGIHRKKR